MARSLVARFPLAIWRPNGGPGALTVRRPIVELSPETAMGELRRGELLRRLAQRKARDMGGLRLVGDPLLPGSAAPRRHQCIERIPIGDAVGFGGKARVIAPIRRAHHPEPRRPLAVLTRRDCDVAVTRGQDRDGGAIAVPDPLARPAPAAEPGIRQFADRHGCQRLLDR